jgi:uroporphyrinogen-III synthase
MASLPLAGRRIVITRGAKQSAPLRSALEALGAEVLTVPAIRFAPPEDLSSFEAALERRERFTHLVFTSQVAASSFASLSAAAGVPASAWRRQRIAAIGARTACALREAGLEPDLVGRSRSGIDFAALLVEKERIGPGARVLLPQSAIAQPQLGTYLESAGAAVERAVVYRTLPSEPEAAAPFLAALDAGVELHAIVFASPSAVRAFLELAGERGRRELAQGRMKVVSIGPTTSAALAAEGLEAHVEAARPDELAAAVAAALS